MMAHPGLLLFGTALLVTVLAGRARQVVTLLGALAALAAALNLPADGLVWAPAIAGHHVELLRVDSLSRIFALIFTLITAIGAVFALHVRGPSEQASVLVYAGGALGVTLAGDWIAAFLFWELMAAASLAVIWHGRTAESQRAGFRYLLVHATGGSLLLAGILIHVAGGADASFTGWAATWQAGWSPAAVLMLLGVSLNAAIPPLHAWLTDAYPEASVTGTVFLSAFTTKTAVYLLIRAFPGSDLLLWGGIVMALYGVVYAVLENDIRRLLAYHIISQVGYMVAAVGMGTPMALNGAVAHAFCHILYKALLLMGAGAVVEATGRRKLTELGGIAGRMPAVTTLYMVGAFSISGVPLFNGFISKAVVISATAYHTLPGPELLLTLASIGTFLHTGLKLPYFTFFGPDRGIRPAPLPANMIVGMTLAAVACTLLGIFPGWLYARLPFQPFEYHPYTVDHIVGTVQLLLGTGVAFWFLLPKLAGEPTVSIDTDWFYRGPFRGAVMQFVKGAAWTGEVLRSSGAGIVAGLARASTLGSEGRPFPDAYFAPIGITLLWVLAAVFSLWLFGWVG
ncbi:MAG: Na(+)/H(+) antiporter subunit D [Acidobacteria bacterium]|nr:Na(+)/H(+) antiporter subunit D [Acidobacteriota bacterium]